LDELLVSRRAIACLPERPHLGIRRLDLLVDENVHHRQLHARSLLSSLFCPSRLLARLLRSQSPTRGLALLLRRPKPSIAAYALTVAPVQYPVFLEERQPSEQ
jgi:hypothetical protein